MVQNNEGIDDGVCTAIQKRRFYTIILRMDRDVNSGNSNQQTNNININNIWEGEFRGIEREAFLACVRRWEIEDEDIFTFDQSNNTIRLTNRGRNTLEEQE